MYEYDSSSKVFLLSFQLVINNLDRCSDVLWPLPLKIGPNYIFKKIYRIESVGSISIILNYVALILDVII